VTLGSKPNQSSYQKNLEAIISSGPDRSFAGFAASVLNGVARVEL
jgi:hypothetical protein